MSKGQGETTSPSALRSRHTTSDNPVLTRLQVKEGDDGSRQLIIVDSKVYDITDFVVDHPGGEDVIRTQIGKDATDVFNAMHPASAHELLANFYVGDLEKRSAQEEREAMALPSAQFAKEMRELRSTLEQKGYFKSSPVYYTYKIVSTLAICIAGLSILYVWGQTSTAAVISAAVLVGIFWQQCGWLAHDFGHHQVFEDHEQNDALVMFLGCLCQGFSLSWWKNKHNTHHASTNVSGHDPDIDTAPILLWDTQASAAFYESLAVNPGTINRFLAEHVLPYQTRYYFFVLAFARLSWAIQSLLYSFYQGAINKSPRLNILERVFLVSHWLIFSYCTIFWIKSLTGVLFFFAVSQAVTGYALAFVFAMNHNGMPVISQEKAECMEFFELQVLTGRDVSLGHFGDWFMGGLNYQIEHHVFPDMPRHNLKKVKPMVKALCKKYHVYHHDTTFIKGTLEVLNVLDVAQKMSQNLSKKVF